MDLEVLAWISRRKFWPTIILGEAKFLGWNVLGIGKCFFLFVAVTTLS